MKIIEAIDIWKDGQSTQAVLLKMYISYDDLTSTATFQYQLCDDMFYPVAEGRLQISGDDYLNWGGSGNSNEEAYVYGAAQLNLVIIGEYVPPVVEPIIEV